MTILVTGGAGYIGSHVCRELINQGYKVVVIDNLINGHSDIVHNVLKVPLVVGNIGDKELVQKTMREYSIRSVLHFSSFIEVGESVKYPLKFYQNNVSQTMNLLEVMLEEDVKEIVFSSTCAVYSEVKVGEKIDEEHPLGPVSPYGQSKLMVENILRDLGMSHGLKSMIFRYFNAAGADPSGSLGENHQPESHLIPLLLQTALGQRKSFNIFGTDYSTKDGTCIRDFIHVNDLATVHVLGLNYLQETGHSQILNLGTGDGYSVKEVVDITQKVTQKNLDIIECPRRNGDAPYLVAHGQKTLDILQWKPQYSQLENIISDAWNWHQNL